MKKVNKVILFVYNNKHLFLFQNQIQEFKQSQTQNKAQLQTMLLDPAVNLVFQRMTKEMEECQEKLKQTQNELSAWKFTPDRCLFRSWVTIVQSIPAVT